MKKNEIIIVGGLIIFFIVCIFLFAGKKDNNKVLSEETQKDNQVKEEYVEVLGDGTKLNASGELNKNKYLGDLSFENIQLTNSNGQSVFYANITNTGTKASEMKMVNIIVLDNTNNELGKVGGVIIPLQPGQSTQFNSSSQIDYTNAYDFRIEEIKE